MRAVGSLPAADASDAACLSCFRGSPMEIRCETETPGELAQRVTAGPHHLRIDVPEPLFGKGSAPDPHDLFDAALAGCKATTAHWYARTKGIPLERVEVHVERKDDEERKGVYVLRVRLAFHGPLSEEQRQKLHDVVGRCPIHKLMTTTEVRVETAPLEPPGAASP